MHFSCSARGAGGRATVAKRRTACCLIVTLGAFPTRAVLRARWTRRQVLSRAARPEPRCTPTPVTRRNRLEEARGARRADAVRSGRGRYILVLARWTEGRIDRPAAVLRVWCRLVLVEPGGTLHALPVLARTAPRVLIEPDLACRAGPARMVRIPRRWVVVVIAVGTRLAHAVQ